MNRGYAPRIACLPTRLTNYLVTARIETHGVGGDCTAMFDEHALIDDVEIRTDPSCPAR